jgi:hypothetical protein
LRADGRSRSFFSSFSDFILFNDFPFLPSSSSSRGLRLSFFPSHFFDFFPYFTDILGFFLFPTAAAPAPAGVGIGNILFLCAFTFGSRVEVDSVLFGRKGSWVRARGWFLVQVSTSPGYPWEGIDRSKSRSRRDWESVLGRVPSE